MKPTRQCPAISRVRHRRATARAVAALGALALLAGPGPAAADTTIELRSSGGYVSTRLPPGAQGVELLEQTAGGCRFGRTWGFDLTRSELWVDGGCGGRFSVQAVASAETSPADSGTGAAIAAALAIAGIAILASRDDDDRPDSRPPAGVWHQGPIHAAAGPCLQASSGALALARCDGGRNQRFSWTRGGELRVEGRCLDLVRGGQGPYGSPLAMRPCDGSSGQRWRADGPRIRSAEAGRCLDARRANRPGDRVGLDRCDGSNPQRWWW